MTQSTRPSRWKNRTALILLLVSFFLPASIAWTLFFTGWVPGSTGNHGTLVEPPHRLEARLFDADGEPVPASALRGRWSMLVISAGACGADCTERLLELGQVRLALAQNMDRARTVLLLPEGEAAPGHEDLDEEIAVYWAAEAALPANDPAATAPLSVSLLDTRGYRMMRYEEPFEAYGLLQDMKRLLRISNIDIERLQGLSEDA